MNFIVPAELKDFDGLPFNMKEFKQAFFLKT
jgi:hypothetical protein